jgi:Trk K+ transport system NAD-binding subunit
VAVDLVEQGVEVVAAEVKADGRFPDAARSHGIAVVVTNGRSPETLHTLRIDRARAVIAATDDDAANLATALHARAARPDIRVVVRLFDADLAARLDRSFGGFETRSVSALAAPAFASAAIGRRVLATIPIGVGRVLIIASVPVEPGSAADASTIAQEEDHAFRIERGGCRVLAVAQGDRVAWKANPEHRLEAGDELVVVATRSGLARIVQRTESSTRHGPLELPVAVTLELPVIGRVDVPSLGEAARRVRGLVGME